MPDESTAEDFMAGHCTAPENECEGSCLFKRLISLLGRKYTLDVLRVIMQNEYARFNTIQKDIGGSPKTITERLTELREEGLVLREAFAEIPPRVEYSLTEKGKDLQPMWEAIRKWGEKWG